MKPLFILLTCLLIAGSCRKKNETALVRSFHMAVTPWPADFTVQAVDEAYAFINNHCDMVSHHFDEGIPYEEAWQQLNWPLELRNDVAARKQKTAAGKKIFLSVSALNLTRHEKADYYRLPDAIPDSIQNYWEQLSFNDPKVITAYTRYVLYLIGELHPSYVNFGVESNEPSWSSSGFDLYRDFLSQVYSQLKAVYPSLPFFVSFMALEDPNALSRAAQLVSLTDHIAISAYPYTVASSTAGGNTDPDLLPADYFTRYLDLAPAKPWGFAETGYNAQDLVISSFNLNKQGNPQWQDAYLDLVCRMANERKAKYLVWFCSSDYDAANNRLKQMGLYMDLFGLWQDTGFIDELGQQRPAWQTWSDWHKRKLQ